MPASLHPNRYDQNEGRPAAMILHWSPRSPFVRKVMVTAHELTLADRIETVRTLAAMSEPNARLMRDNPLSKIPTLVLDDGTALYDSIVICEYLDGLAGGNRLFPAEPARRLDAMRRHALANGLLDLLVLRRNERDRPDGARSDPHLTAFAVKTAATLAAMEREAQGIAAMPFDIGHVTLGCALAYLDFRFAADDWRSGHPRLAAWHAAFAARPSAAATAFADG
jgi:glutathione S-transferase